MTAIAAVRRGMKELVDGTLRVQIDIDPAYRAQFFELFPDIDMPIALTPLLPEYQREEKPKGGPLSKLAGIWCAEPTFQQWVREQVGTEVDEEGAAGFVRYTCGIPSRAELDSNEVAAEIFHREIRQPFREWLASGAIA